MGDMPLDAGIIRLAVGSRRESSLRVPSTADVEGSWGGSLSQGSVSTIQSGSNPSIDTPDGLKSKVRKWRNFGGLFGKNGLSPTSPSTPFYEVDPMVQEDMAQQPPLRKPDTQPAPVHEAKLQPDQRPVLDSHEVQDRRIDQLPPREFPKIEGKGLRRKRSLRKMLSEKRIGTSLRPTVVRSKVWKA